MMLSIMKRTNNIDKYCACASALKKNTTNKRLVSGGNNPQISQKIRYSEIVRTSRTKEIIVPLERPVIVQTVSPSF